MSENVLQQLEGTTRIVARIENNLDLCNVFMALLGRTCLMAAQRGLPVEGISFGEPTVTEKRISARVTFSGLTISSHAIFGRGTSFDEWAASKSQGMAAAMKRNPNFGTFFEKVLRVVDGFCADKGRDFKHVKVYKAFIDPDNTIVLWLK